MKAEFRFYGPLNDFLPPPCQAAAFTYSFLLPGAVKDMIEALGVPHPEVDLILANGHPADLSYRVQDGDRIAVYPAFFSIDISALPRMQRTPDSPCFVLDGHLGVLAGYLRLLGFDSVYQKDWRDEDLARVSSRENRILLTRDRGLLKRATVTCGYCVRATAPRRQLQEVIQRYGLLALVQPFRRCIRCNGLLRRGDKESVRARLPERVATQFTEFTICDSCGRVYWRGSHFQRMQRFLREVMQAL